MCRRCWGPSVGPQHVHGRRSEAEEVARSDPEPDSPANTPFAPCHLRRLWGRGGMDEIYEGEDAAKVPIAG